MKISSIILATLLGVLILFNSLRVSCTYAYYELDPIGFIEQLCINKDKPELQCNGKCHLKKVAKSSTNENNEPTYLIDFKQIFLYSAELYNYNFSPAIGKEKNLLEYNNLYAFTSLNACFRPPKV